MPWLLLASTVSSTMCYFITISIPDSGIEFAKEKIPRNIHLSPSSNPATQNLIPNNYQHLYVTSGGCSCDLFNEDHNESTKDKIEEKLRRKYKKKGWSENKIQRAVSQANTDSTNNRSVGLSDDLKFYISDLLTKIKDVRLLIHWYSGVADQEKIEIKHGPTISSYQLRTQNPVTETDIIYKIES